MASSIEAASNNGSRNLEGTELLLRAPEERDGEAIWRLVKQSGALDVNSAYLYIMLSSYFQSTCAIAELGSKPVGFVTGFRPPERFDTWFVWQIAVDKEARGQGLARRLLDHVLAREENRGIRFLEATISPSNKASQSLFLGFARDRHASCQVSEGFPEELFPLEGNHEDEKLFQIGPFQNE